MSEWYGIKNDRFYTILVSQKETIVNYGKIGGKTTINKKNHKDSESAEKFYQKTIKNKTKDEFRNYSREDFIQLNNREKKTQSKTQKTHKTQNINDKDSKKEDIQVGKEEGEDYNKSDDAKIDDVKDKRKNTNQLYNWGYEEEEYDYSEWSV